MAACFGAAMGGAAPYPDLSKGRPPEVLDARIGANLRLGDDPAELPATQRGQAEPHVVRSAANPQVLLATFQEGRYFDGGALGCGYAVSRDGGLTWRRGLVPNLTPVSGGRYVRSTDPVAGAGPQGDLYLQNLVALQGVFTIAAVVVSRSTDRGDTWSEPVTVFEARNRLVQPDKNWLAVNDYPQAANAGRLVSTWTSFISNSAGASLASNLESSYSDDRGATWSAPAAITPPGGDYQATQPLFLPDGSLYVVYIEFLDANDVTRYSIQGRHSVDGGRTYAANATRIIDVRNGWDDPAMRDGVFLPAATVARGTGELFVTYTAVVEGTPRVHVTKSGDRGATWSRPVVVSDQPAGGSVMNPAIAVTPDGRNVSVVFMDRRHSPDPTSLVDHYVALSPDGGATWQRNLRLTEMSSPTRYGPSTARGTMLGDYLGLAPSLAPEQPCVAVWCDTRTGDSDPYAVRFMPAAAGNFGTWRLAHGLGSAGTDTDGDGQVELVEFVSGTDPRKADSGEAEVLRRVEAEALEVAWLQRPEVEVPVVHVATGTLEMPSPATVPLRNEHPLMASESLPPNKPSGTLVWRGIRAAVPAGSAVAVARYFRPEAEAPAVRGGEVAVIGTEARLANLSIRGRIGPDLSPLLVGFAVDGSKSLLVRAAGPALTILGVPEALAEPQLSLLGPGANLLRANSRWAEGGATAELFARVGAFPFASGSRDAALAVNLERNAYNVVVGSANRRPGVALVEIYDTDAPAPSARGPRLVNLSYRAEPASGGEAQIAGLVIAGLQPRRVLIRAVGPTLAAFGLSGAMPDPVLTLYRGSSRLAANDDWEISRSAGAVALQASRVGAFALESASLDAAILITLAPGAYTVVVNSADARSGVVLLEVYDAD